MRETRKEYDYIYEIKKYMVQKEIVWETTSPPHQIYRKSIV